MSHRLSDLDCGTGMFLQVSRIVLSKYVIISSYEAVSYMCNARRRRQTQDRPRGLV
jgi:hypothetical protein